MKRPWRICIGLHVRHHGTAQATIAALHESTAPAFELVLLPDAGVAMPPQWPTLGPNGTGDGAVAAFNRLLAQDADLYVFLEDGVRPAPDWLERLIEALDANPAGHGLAGPSTNHSWNAQALAAGTAGTRPALEVASQRLRERVGASWQDMGPQHNLADFCLAVRREVVQVIGGADPAYGQGPCWEMDYTARAAHAGFRSVWAQSALVWRAPGDAARATWQATLIEPNKRLYQDRFCARRRATAATLVPHHAHCLGEQCADFVAPVAPHFRLPDTPVPPPWPAPLVSCIMPTRGRPRFVAQALQYFRQQDHGPRELVIVHEHDEDLPGPIDEPGVRVIRTHEQSIGAKRNIGVGAARGEIIAQWDDDDWHGPQRLSRQIRPIVQGVADITGLNDVLFMVTRGPVFWGVSRDLFRQMFHENVSGGTLVYRRELWERFGPYPATSLREDADFLTAVLRGGARLCRLPGRDLCIYVRHPQNTWTFREGAFISPSGWHRVEEPAALAPHRAFYEGPAAPALHLGLPLVSCIMPTANRRRFVPEAIHQFLAQDHARRELVVIDDGADSVADLVPEHPTIRYLRHPPGEPLGSKRNLACAQASGDLIAHWDDDDWRGPAWLSSQVQTLRSERADLCGLDRVFFYDPSVRKAWRYVYDGALPWVCGGTLTYTRALWERNPFPPLRVGEDNAFVWNGRHPMRLAINPRHDLYVACVHPSNTSPKATGSRRWHRIPVGQVEQLIAKGSET